MKVAVLGGGPSPERDISLATAEAIVEHLPAAGYDPVPVEIRADGAWLIDGGEPTGPATAAARLLELGIGVVFPGLHGAWGEDGVVQGFLEVAGFPYVGSGVVASALAMDKVRTRDVLEPRGLTMPEAYEFTPDTGRDGIDRALATLGLPLVVKDPVGGSSLGTTIADTAEEAAAALDLLLSPRSGRALVEEHVAGSEFSCPVLGNASVGGALTALPVILIRPRGDGWFDYETKYDPDAVDEICPAPIEPELEERIRSDSLLAHRTLRCDGLTRSDFIVPADGEPRFLEINTLPGLTPASLSPKSAAAAGIPFSDLLGRLVKMAREKAHPERLP